MNDAYEFLMPDSVSPEAGKVELHDRAQDVVITTLTACANILGGKEANQPTDEQLAELLHRHFSQLDVSDAAHILHYWFMRRPRTISGPAESRRSVVRKFGSQSEQWEAAIEAMMPCWADNFANPASQHARGKAARELVERARVSILNELGAQGYSLVFTSGATEANNLALIGAAAAAASSRGRHILVSAIEHPSVLEPLVRLRRSGFTVEVVPVDKNGRIQIDRFEQMLRDDTLLVSVGLANHEVGVVQLVERIAGICRRRGILLHSDCTQAVGKMPLSVSQLDADFVTLSAHKIYGPKGVGALLARTSPVARLQPLLRGGHEEDGLRPGTLPVPLIVGFAKAVQMATKNEPRFEARMAPLRDRFEQQVLSGLVGVVDVRVNGGGARRLAHVSNLSFIGVPDGKQLIDAVQRRICVSAGSACQSALHEPSPVLAAMHDPRSITASVRVSTGLPTTVAEIEFAADVIVENVRSLSSTSAAEHDHAYYEPQMNTAKR